MKIVTKMFAIDARKGHYENSDENLGRCVSSTKIVGPLGPGRSVSSTKILAPWALDAAFRQLKLSAPWALDVAFRQLKS